MVVWITCFAAAGIGLWIDVKSARLEGTDPARSVGWLAGALVGSFLISFLVGFIVAKAALRLIGRRPWVGRAGFALGACLFVSILAVGEQRIRGRVSEESSTGKIAHGPVDSAEGNTLVTNEIRAYLALVNRRNDQYVRDMAKIAGDGLVQPAKLDTAAKIAVLRVKLAQLRKLTDDFESGSRDAGEAALRRVEAMPIADAEKQSFAASYRQSHKASQADDDEMFSLSRQFYDEVEKLADFMGARLGVFKIDGNSVVFKSTDDAAAYNQIIARLIANAKQQQELTARAKEKMQQSADDLNRM
ncbi:MAG TPA: hypothetical protein VG269_17645 [Tepidisphaeraceae bacterium]|jgi:hypothetical protein|nr:hypothetical protein [Tepidisphaeraceae bacterium]